MTGKDTIYFQVTDGPGPFRFLTKVADFFDDSQDKPTFEFELRPVGAGEKLIGHNSKFRLRFEVALLGPVTTGKEAEPCNIRLLGRFLLHDDFFSINHNCPYVSPFESRLAASKLREWQWEVIFPAQGHRRGKVLRLKQPLPRKWVDPYGIRIEACAEKEQECSITETSPDTRKAKILMIVVQKIIARYQNHHRGNLDEEIFRLFEKAKRVSFAEDARSLSDAISDILS